jgi:uncharacterized protein YkwD
VRHVRLSNLESLLWQEAKGWAKRRQSALRFDARLARAAKDLLNSVPTTSQDTFDRKVAKDTARRWGVTDGYIAIVSLRIKRGAKRHFLQELENHLSDTPITHLGLASKRYKGDILVVALLTQRLLRLIPFPALVNSAQAGLLLEGTLYSKTKALSLTSVVHIPSIGIKRATHAFKPSGRFNLRLEHKGAHSGEKAQVQLLLERGHGPEIAAEFTLALDTQPWGPPPVHPYSSLSTLHGLPHNQDNLLEALWGVRTSQGLDLPVESRLLSTIAQAHAADMAEHGFFAHRSPRTGTVIERLRRHKVDFSKAFENIAQVRRPDEVMPLWLDSPSHRANLLEPSISAVGIGLAPSPTHPDRLYVVLILLRTAIHGSTLKLEDLAVGAIDKHRGLSGRRPLIRNSSLNALARRHSQHMAKLGHLSMNSPLWGTLKQAVTQESEFSKVGIDIYRVEAVDAVRSSTYILRPFRYIGLGIYQDRTTPRPTLWLTVIYATEHTTIPNGLP